MSRLVERLLPWCPMLIRLIISLILYLLYVYADFIAMAYWAYNAFYVPKEPMHLITVVVAIMFLCYGVLTAFVLEWIWKHQLPLQEPSYLAYWNDKPAAMRLIATIVLWFVCFNLTTYVLFWLGSGNDDTNVYAVLMFILLFTGVPTIDLYMSWHVKLAFWSVCRQVTTSRGAASREEDNTELSQQQRERLLIV